MRSRWWIVAGLVAAAAALAWQSGSEAQAMRSEPVAGHVHVLYGRGGNIGVSVGPDGVFLVDDQFAPATPDILAAVEELGGGAPRFLLNTHWHGDHTGGNENLGKSGATIFAHHEVRTRMASPAYAERFGSAAAPGALPVVTYGEGVTFHVNGDTVRAFHVGPAHTDGDTVLHFEQADVIHMGDTFFNGLYPFVDLSSGGSVPGVQAAVEQVLALCGDGTKVIPGHGPVTDRAGLTAYRDMLKGCVDAVRALMDEGKDQAAVVAAKPTAPWDEVWGGGFIAPDAFAATIFKSLSDEAE